MVIYDGLWYLLEEHRALAVMNTPGTGQSRMRDNRRVYPQSRVDLTPYQGRRDRL
jgi:hypothetical protein